MTAKFLIFSWHAFGWLFVAFVWGAAFWAVMGLWLGAMSLARTALLRTLEVSAIVEAALEAKRLGRAPILRAWQWLHKRGEDGS